MKREDIFERVFPSSPCISLPSTLSLYSTTLLSGVTIGVGYSLAQLNDALHFIVSEQPKEKTKTYHAPLQHLRTLAGAQIRSMAVYSLVLYEISHIYTQAYSSVQASKHYSEEESQVNVKQVSTKWV